MIDDKTKLELIEKMYADVLEFCEWKEHTALDALLNCIMAVVEWEGDKEEET